LRSGPRPARPWSRPARQAPTLIESKTYRTVGHHEGDPLTGTDRTQAEVDEWAARPCRPPSGAAIIEDDAIVSGQELDQIDAAHRRTRSRKAIDFARASRRARSGDGASPCHGGALNPAVARSRSAGPVETTELGWLDAVRDGIAEEMRRNRNIVYFGEGTGERGGTFAHTKNLYVGSSVPTAWSTRRSPNSASLAPRWAQRPPACAVSPT